MQLMKALTAALGNSCSMKSLIKLSGHRFLKTTAAAAAGITEFQQTQQSTNYTKGTCNT